MQRLSHIDSGLWKRKSESTDPDKMNQVKPPKQVETSALPVKITKNAARPLRGAKGNHYTLYM